MHKIIKYTLFISLVLFYSAVCAQSTETDTPVVEAVVDSAYDMESVIEENDRKEFGYYESQPRFEERKMDQEALNQVKNDEAYWYANMEVTPKKVEEKKLVVQNTNWLNTLFWILLVGGFVTLLIWLLSSSNISLFRRRPGEIETKEEETENIFEVNFEKEIQAAIASGNYRLGVRLMYLQVLRIMADEGIIRYTAEKTNSDYLFQLASTRYYKDFSRLTRNFDYVWYGKFPLSPESFGALQKDFSSFKQSLA